MTAGVASGTTWNVAPTGCSNTTCNPCCSIQAAVERASGGDTVSIAPGTYPEEVDVRDMLSVGDINFEANGGPGIDFWDLSGPGPFAANCNDVVGNSTGVYLSDPLTVDATRVWWGDPTGPSGQGSGAGDSIFAEPGGTITYNPWLLESITSPVTTCETFTSGFESGLIEEWGVVVQ